MISTTSRFRYALLAVVALASLCATAQKRRDPLTDDEVDQLREQAQNPEDRLKLWVKFTRARITAMDQLRGDPKLASAAVGERYRSRRSAQHDPVRRRLLSGRR